MRETRDFPCRNRLGKLGIQAVEHVDGVGNTRTMKQMIERKATGDIRLPVHDPVLLHYPENLSLEQRRNLV